ATRGLSQRERQFRGILAPVAATSADVMRRLGAEGLRDLFAMVNSSRGLDEILSYLVVQAQQVLGSDAASLYLRDQDDPTLLRVQATHGVPSDLLNSHEVVGFPIAGLPVTTRRSVVLADHVAANARPVT